MNSKDHTISKEMENGDIEVVSRIQEQLNAAQKVIEFYADKNNWTWSAGNEKMALYSNIDGDFKVSHVVMGGKRAREYFERWTK